MRPFCSPSWDGTLLTCWNRKLKIWLKTAYLQYLHLHTWILVIFNHSNSNISNVHLLWSIRLIKRPLAVKFYSQELYLNASSSSCGDAVWWSAAVSSLPLMAAPPSVAAPFLAQPAMAWVEFGRSHPPHGQERPPGPYPGRIPSLWLFRAQIQT